MRPPETMPHGTVLVFCEGGYRIRRPDGSAAGRIRVRCRRDRNYWVASCDAWDGFTWTRDKVISHPMLTDLELAVQDYAAWIDHQAYVASGDCYR